MTHNQLLSTVKEKEDEKKTLLLSSAVAILAGCSLAMSIVFYIK